MNERFMNERLSRPSTPHPLVVLGLCICLSLFAPGCTTFFGKNRGPVDNLDMTAIKMNGYSTGPNGVMQALPNPDETPSVILEINDGKKAYERLSMTSGQPLFIGDVVRDANFYKKIGRINVTILRPTQNGAPIRLDVDFDDSGKRVMEGTNYSLRPGDHIVVSADQRSFLSRLTEGTAFERLAN
jgi:hypothetical protein